MIREALRLSNRERLLIIQAGVLLVSTQIGIRLLPYRRLREVLDSIPSWPLSNGSSSEDYRNQTRWAIDVVDNLTPGQASCLERALVAEFLLARRGHDATIRFGVDGSSQDMTAHAWVESNGEVLIGGETRGEYTALENQGCE